jgi:uncharacterized protein (DUF1800 family)
LQDITAFNGLGGTDDARLSAYIEAQMNPASIADTACTARLNDPLFTTLNKTIPQLWADHIVATVSYQQRMRPAHEVECAALTRAVYSERQLQERMTEFWHNHFHVFGWHYDSGPMFVQYDRDVIRPNVFGNYRVMLEASAKSPSMLMYLNNASNVAGGPNENYARELLELHGLGAENYLGASLRQTQVPGYATGTPSGYVDEDVYNVTRALTGWSLRNGHWQYPTQNDGTFVARSAWHDPYPKEVLALRLPYSVDPLADGHAILDRIAQHPGTGRFVCRKLARRFVGDDPAQSLVDAMASVFTANWNQPDQLKRVYRVLFLSNEFKTSFGDKVKRPVEYFAHALRVVNANHTFKPDGAENAYSLTEELLDRLVQSGQRPYYWSPPNGFPDRAGAWRGTSALAMGWRMFGRIVEAKVSDVFIADVLAQTTAALAAPNRTATQIVDFWLNRVFGYSIDPAQRTKLIDFLRQNGTATEALNFDTDAWNGNDLKAHYNQQRLRTLVAMMLSTPEFILR